MNREDIIRMAREADLETIIWQENLMKFAALVAAKALEASYGEMIEIIRADEREACAKVCDEQDHDGVMIASDCAAAIRARGD